MGSSTWIAIGAIGLTILMMLGASAPLIEDTTYIRFIPEQTDRTYTGWLDWGTLYPGYNVTKIITFENGYPSNIRVRATTDHWQPEHAGDWLQLTWDSEDVELPVNVTRDVQFHLYAPWDIGDAAPPIEHFSFDIVITVICEDCVIEP